MMKIKAIGVAIALLIMAGAILCPPVQAQGMPHAVLGYVRDTAGEPVGNATVTVLNERTGDTITAKSNYLGQYQADLFSLASGYQVGDVIEVSAVFGELEGSAKVTVSSGALDQCNVIVSEPSGNDSIVILGIVAVIMIVVATIALAMMYRKPPAKKQSEKGRRR